MAPEARAFSLTLTATSSFITTTTATTTDTPLWASMFLVGPQTAGHFFSEVKSQQQLSAAWRLL
jgi:hypothetical protein